MYPYYSFVMDGLTYIKDFLVLSGFWSQPIVDVQRASAQLAIPTENKLQAGKYLLRKAFAETSILAYFQRSAFKFMDVFPF